MAEVTYTTVTWTSGDTMTEAKLDNMVANDRAVDAMAQGVEYVERAAPSTPGANKAHMYAKDKSGLPTIFVKNDAGTDYELSEGQPSFVFTAIGVLTTGTSVAPTLIAHRALTIVKAYAEVKTAPTGAVLILDLNKNGSTIWATQGNRVQIAAGATSGTETSFDTTTLAEGDLLTLDIDQIGSTVSGADLTIMLRCK